jgi:signal transduction histidine kinase
MGFGLVGMQERSQRIGGKFSLTSTIGQGTEIVVWRFPDS